mmetsp:Transcript_24342/g.36211  ORF Transcript_24342/g.36211 Transcript_24342/m.36211 type:complete len:682 (+) Transcript_24342:77-2122(+)
MASARAIQQPQCRRYRYLIVTFGSVAFLVASQFILSLSGIHLKDLENELGTIVQKIQGNQQDIAKNESGDSIGPRVSCDSSPCKGFFAYDGPNKDKKAVKDILQKAAVAEYNNGRQRNNETHNTTIFMPNTTNHSISPLPHVKHHGQAASCTFCNILNEPDLVLTGTGGNTCGSIQLMAAKEVNGSDICAILQKEEGVCCPGPEPASQQGPVHQRSEGSIVGNRPVHEQVGASQPEKKGSSEKEQVLERTKCTFCRGGFPYPDLIVPQTGGNTCCSIQMLAVEEYNGTYTCEILREQENACCPEPEQSTHLALEEPSDTGNVAIHVMGGSGLCSQLMMLLVSQLYYEKICHRNFMVDESFFDGYRRSSSEGVLTGFFTPQVPVLDEVKDRSIFAKKWLPVSAQQDPFWALPLEGGFRRIATSSPNSIKDAVGSETPLVISGVVSHRNHFRSGWKKLCKMQKTDDMLHPQVDWHYLYYSLIPYACNNFQFNNHTQNEIKAHLLEHNISTSSSNPKMVAFHIRRSDKVRTRESSKYTAKTYVKKWINSLGERGDTTAQSFTHCFIASDEFAAVEEFRAVLDDQKIPCHVLTLTPTARRGTTMKKQAELGYAESLTFLAEMSVLVEAEYFVGTMGSSVGAFVTLMRSCPAFFRGEKFKDYKEELTKNHYYNSFGVDTDWYIRVA